METTANVKLYSLTYRQAKTYIFALLFICGNIVLPQLCHLIPGGGLTWLPIYFFTLIAAYKYGIRVGLLTAVLSPLINNLLFGMPSMAILPLILSKSILLAIIASIAAYRSKSVTILAVLLVVLAYQLLGTVVEWFIVKDFYLAIQDFRIGIPGMLIQILGGYTILKLISRI